VQIKENTTHAIQILRYLHKNQGLQTAQNVADAVGITAPLFKRIAMWLKQENLITHIAGRDGGYTLGRPAEEISFYDVFWLTKGELYPNNHCAKRDINCEGENHCKLHQFIKITEHFIIEDMLGTSIADLA